MKKVFKKNRENIQTHKPHTTFICYFHYHHHHCMRSNFHFFWLNQQETSISSTSGGWEVFLVGWLVDTSVTVCLFISIARLFFVGCLKSIFFLLFWSRISVQKKENQLPYGQYFYFFNWSSCEWTIHTRVYFNGLICTCAQRKKNIYIPTHSLLDGGHHLWLWS